MEFKKYPTTQMRVFTIVFIFGIIIKFTLGQPVALDPPLTEDPKTVDDIVKYFVQNTKLTYDYRSPAITEEVQKILHYLHGKNSETRKKYLKLEGMLHQFQARIKKFTNNCGINDVLMILAPGIVREFTNTNDAELLALSESFRSLVQMNEVDRQVRAVKKMEDFMKGKQHSDVLQFHTKYVAWERAHCYGVSVWDE
uniref:Uncharacterized protein n=1 Tax=Stomoxys calcitrans TaxID=35570 RepID=A0A1I8P1B4_STOCA